MTTVYDIWIGDDDSSFVAETERRIKSALVEDGLKQGEDFSIVCYTDPLSLRSAALQDRLECQFLVLDMEFGAANGIEVAKDLRNIGLSCPLVYLTSYRDYVFDSFVTRPVDYLIKPPNWDRLAGLIRQDFRERYAAARLNLKFQSRLLSLQFDEVYALEAYAHHVRIWLREENIEWNGSLSALEPQLPVWCFCHCHSSYWINLSHVAELNRVEAKMDNGLTFPVSKRLAAAAARQHFAFLSRI